MTRLPTELPALLNGLQAYVATPFGDDGELDLPRFRAHLDRLIHGHEKQPAGCFVACGTGELPALDLDEHRRLVEAAVDVVGRSVPVIAGVGYGTRLAVAMARNAQEAGADGILVFPPYLFTAPQAGLYEHYRRIAESVSIGVMIYNRDNAVFAPETTVQLAERPNLIGLKDGHGDLDAIRAMQAAIGKPFVFGNGMPVAETFAPTYLPLGIRGYSPGVFDFLPELSWRLDGCLERGDRAGWERLLDAFYRPYAELRKQTPGLGIGAVKAGLEIRGVPFGRVRPPLADLTPAQRAELERLIETGLILAAEKATATV
jgi:5-dehydro-4-deoxyglucarate dehydratase